MADEKSIEVTDQMIEAGVVVAESLIGIVSPYFLVRAVYTAMAQKSASSDPLPVYPSSSE